MPDDFLHDLTKKNAKPIAANAPRTINKMAHQANDFLSGVGYGCGYGLITKLALAVTGLPPYALYADKVRF